MQVVVGVLEMFASSMREEAELWKGLRGGQSPGDADLHVALGVLSSLAREYNGAVSAFRAALQLRENDYSLWNKLGATLANSSNAAEAITAYQKALELKPNYMRAWTNMGISHVRPVFHFHQRQYATCFLSSYRLRGYLHGSRKDP